VIDTHCHLLPGLDDGPATIDEAIALAHVLVDQGVELVVCTPHYSRQYPTDHERARQALRVLCEELDAREVPLRLELAAEVADATAVTAPGAELQGRAIRRRYCVVEIVGTTAATTFDAVATRFIDFGLVPVFAHPERNRAVQRDASVLDWSRSLGALVQVVAPSLTGRWGDAAEAAAWELVGSGRADLLASDAHGVERRRCRLREAFDLVAAWATDDVARRLVQLGPERLVPTRGLRLES
jgi:protein-tyrosine phosphatase